MTDKTESLHMHTIGFTNKSAEKFFTLIKSANIKTLLDVRLNNISQLSGYAKKNDLKFFLKEICNVEYIHIPELAPTKDILDKYKKGDISWEIYEDNFLNLMSQRKIERNIKRSLLDGSCLLCSEHEPHFCHRRLIIEYLNKESNLGIEAKHLY